MSNFYIKIRPLEDSVVSRIIHAQPGLLNAYIYGTFKAHHYYGDNTYHACNLCGQEIYINVKERFAYIVIDGTPYRYGKITEFCRTEFGNKDKYLTFCYHRKQLESLSKIIKGLEKQKHMIIKVLKEDYYGRKNNSN